MKRKLEKPHDWRRDPWDEQFLVVDGLYHWPKGVQKKKRVRYWLFVRWRGEDVEKRGYNDADHWRFDNRVLRRNRGVATVRAYGWRKPR